MSQVLQSMFPYAFSKIYIVESLGDSEGEPGRRLEHALSYLKSIAIEYINAPDRASMDSALEHILRETNGGERPIIHIEAHGSSDALYTKLKEKINWADFASGLRPINLASDYNLIVSMACCHGIYLVDSLMHNSACPFAFLIGSPHELYPSSITEGFTHFYTDLLAAIPVREAAAKLENRLRVQSPNAEVETFDCGRAFYTVCGNVFYQSERRRKERLTRMFSLSKYIGLKTDPSLRRKLLWKAERDEIEEFAEKFFALDIIPANRARFDIANHMRKLKKDAQTKARKKI